MNKKKGGIGFFESYLTPWVALCIMAGIAVGQWISAVPDVLGRWEYANVSISIALLIWLMIYPMMLKVDFQSVKNVGKRPNGILEACVTNWLINPFTMFAIAWVFFFVFQELGTHRPRRPISDGNRVARSRSLHGDGICMELSDERRCRLYVGAGCRE